MVEEIPKRTANPMIVIVFQQGDAYLREDVTDVLLSKSPPLSTHRLAGNSKKSLCMTPGQHDERLVSPSGKNVSHQKSEAAECTEEETEHPRSKKKQKDVERRDYIVVQLFLICAVLVLLVISIIVYQLSKDDKVFNTVSPCFTLILGYFFGFHKNKK